jgi:hypothetical protein
MRSFLFIVLAILFFSGCGPTRPEAMPNTFPCKITILQDGVSLSGIDVALFRAEGNGPLSISAYTNSNGVANIKTAWGNYSTSGVPAGTYKITLVKHVALPDDGVTEEQKEQFTLKEAEAYEKKRNEEIDKLRLIPKQMSSPETTPFEITVIEKSRAELTLDIANIK